VDGGFIQVSELRGCVTIGNANAGARIERVKISQPVLTEHFKNCPATLAAEDSVLVCEGVVATKRAAMETVRLRFRSVRWRRGGTTGWVLKDGLRLRHNFDGKTITSRGLLRSPFFAQPLLNLATMLTDPARYAHAFAMVV
jgi:hypothetical protein